jgi:hypothetical protein
MQTISRVAFLTAFLSITSTRPSAQTHAVSDLVLGQVVSFRVAAAPPGSLAIFLLGFNGLGPGTCYPPPISVCLDILEPVQILALVPVDATGNAALRFVLPGELPLVPVYSQALVISISGSNVTVAKTNAVTSPIVPLSSLSDTFDGAGLSPRWSVHNPGLLSATVSGGALHLQPTAGGPLVTWYADGEGPLVYKNVTGDFTVTAIVRADDPVNPSQPPPTEYRLGGLTVRNPAAPPGAHNWAHVTVGGGTAAIPIAVEDKTTVNSTSDLRLYPIQNPRGEIRITRQGTSISLYFRDTAAQTWSLLRSHARPDLPQTLQVGLNVSSWQSPPRVRIHVEEIRFSR